MDPAKLPKTLRKYAHSIDDFDDTSKGFEPNGYWVYFVPGLQNQSDPGLHQTHEMTLAECARDVRDAIPCDCADCKEMISARKTAK